MVACVIVGLILAVLITCYVCKENHEGEEQIELTSRKHDNERPDVSAKKTESKKDEKSETDRKMVSRD